MKKQNLYYFLFFIFLCSSNVRAEKPKDSFRDSVISQVIALEKEKIIAKADKMLSVEPKTVTASISPRSAGGKHDFFSEGPYWWPDPTNPDGPYIRHDGLRNPDRFQDHDRFLGSFCSIVGTMTSAYRLTGQEKYVKAAMRHLKAWFIDTATRMNPGLVYSQAIKGICTGRGIGIIDATPLMDVAQSVLIFEKSPYASEKEIKGAKAWFSEFITWLTTHPYGIEEMNWENNHGSWWHAQAAIYARLTGDQKILQLCRDHFKNKLVPKQMAANGSFPLELERTKPYSYSLFNLDAWAAIAWILDDNDYELWNYSISDGRGLKKGLNFMLPYLKDISKWPYAKDVDNWENQPGPRAFMIYAALAQNSREWFDLWKSLGTKSSGDKNILLWLPFPKTR